MSSSFTPRTVSLITLGCARNEVDSEELAAGLAQAGWELADEGDQPSVVMVNTCGFIQAAKQESIDELLSATESGAKVVAVGCLAERYGAELAAELPETQVLSFDDYGDIGARLDDVLAGRQRPAHTARDRRKLLPISPAFRRGGATPLDPPAPGGMPSPPTPLAPARGVNGPGGPSVGAGEGGGPSVGAGVPSGGGGVASGGPSGAYVPGFGLGGKVFRRRLSRGVVAPLKIASGCDRRCSFCAIPSFRGAFVSRRPEEILAEARWLAAEGVREVLLVSENSTSYGKDLGNLRLLEEILPDLAAIVDRVRISYLQPAEVRPGLIDVIASTPGVAPYFDLSFQHASGPVLRAMRRFGDRQRFLALLDQVRAVSPEAGVRSNFIVGFPGETAADLHELEQFLSSARLDAIGIFGYSDEDGTEALKLPGKLDEAEIARRVEEFADLAEELMAQRAADRVGESVDVLIEEQAEDGAFEGRAAHQAPEVDGVTTVSLAGAAVAGAAVAGAVAIGAIVRARVTGSEGVDLTAEVPGPR